MAQQHNQPTAQVLKHRTTDRSRRIGARAVAYADGKFVDGEFIEAESYPSRRLSPTRGGDEVGQHAFAGRPCQRRR